VYVLNPLFRDKSLAIHDNLFKVFQLEASSEEDYLNTGDIECGICYSYKLNNTSIPDVICSNESCSRGFHHPCLYEVIKKKEEEFEFNRYSGYEEIQVRHKVLMYYLENVHIAIK
jgi:hypothetical protein